jgi:hypothetical protein
MSAGEAQKGGERPSRISSIERGRTFVLFGGFLAGTLTGGWIGQIYQINVDGSSKKRLASYLR